MVPFIATDRRVELLENLRSISRSLFASPPGDQVRATPTDPMEMAKDRVAWPWQSWEAATSASCTSRGSLRLKTSDSGYRRPL